MPIPLKRNIRASSLLGFLCVLASAKNKIFVKGVRDITSPNLVTNLDDNATGNDSFEHSFNGLNSIRGGNNGIQYPTAGWSPFTKPTLQTPAGDALINENTTCMTIYDIACNTTGFENICESINFAGLNDDTFRAGQWTIFLPNNDAINDDMISMMFYESLEFNAFRPFLKDLLLFHSRPNATVHKDEMSCLDGQNIMQMTTGRVSRTLCENDMPMFQRGEGNRDDALPGITQFDIEACNGVVHVVDKLILAS